MPAPLYSIIPGAALQFIDYDVDLSVPVDGKPLALRKKPFAVNQGERKPVFLRRDQNDPDRYLDDQTGQKTNMDYDVEIQKAFNSCLNRWLPIPFLERRGRRKEDQKPAFGFGPTDWVRGFLTRLDSLGHPEAPGAPDNPDSPESPDNQGSLKYRLTLVFDPQAEDGTGAESYTKAGDVIYHALSRKNVEENVRFGLASGAGDLDWFLALPWIEAALRQNLEAFPQNYKKVARLNEGRPESLYEEFGKIKIPVTAHLGIYAAFLEGVALSEALGEVQIAKPDKEPPIEVDLVLDIGNSRLTGILVETQPDRQTQLTDCYTLPIRELSEPARIYNEPVSSRVEFAEPYFGPPELSLKSRRHHNSFPWPSAVRLGPEAARLAADSREDRGPTGMSSPKRYLWDTKPQTKVEWYLNNKYQRHGENEEQAVGRGTFLTKVNSAGLPLSAVNAHYDEEGPKIPEQIIGPKSGERKDENKMVAFESQFSRSSLMLFLLSEVIAQALSAVNDPKKRDTRQPLRPRHLARLILTVPTAMPLVEQNIYKTWAELAVQAVWSALGWDKLAGESPGAPNSFRSRPLVHCNFDEATCTQVVWLFNEVCFHFHKDAPELFELLGQKRDVSPETDDKAKPLSSLRVASIDMGAGTTDLSITTYAIESQDSSSPRIVPHLDFREGFNVAGDDVMHKIIQTQLIDKIIKAAGKPENNRPGLEVKNVLEDTFKPRQITAEDRDTRRRRWQFVNRVAVPLALEVLSLYEKYDHRKDDQIKEVVLRDVFPNGEGNSLKDALEFFEKPLRDAGWRDFRLLDQTLSISLKEVHKEVVAMLQKVMTDLGEVVKLYDCDVLILSGRPSRWPALWLLSLSRLSVPADRLVRMHEYEVGAAYPFVTDNKIKDPKTTVVTGAMICALASNNLEGLTIDTSMFEPQPTIRYLGILDGEGSRRLKREKVWFDDIDVYSEKEDDEKEHLFEFNGPVAVGFRQLKCERWTATKLFNLELTGGKEFPLPWRVELTYSLKEYQKPDPGEKIKPNKVKRTEGTLKIGEIKTKGGNELSSDSLTIRLQTLPTDEGFWLDTGILYK